MLISEMLVQKPEVLLEGEKERTSSIDSNDKSWLSDSKSNFYKGYSRDCEEEEKK